MCHYLWHHSPYKTFSLSCYFFGAKTDFVKFLKVQIVLNGKSCYFCNLNDIEWNIGSINIRMKLNKLI